MLARRSLVIILTLIKRSYNNSSQLKTTLMEVKNNQDNYEMAVEALNKLQSNAQYIKYAKIKNNQENNMAEMKKFLNRTGVSLEMLDRLSVIHVAGTNGKGSTCAYCESILRKHGYKTGFYSSPHLLDVRERIRIDGKPISKQKFAVNFWKIYDILDQQKSESFDMPLYFRFLTIMAFNIFLNEKVDVAILEVGIGGEYDCTNIVRKTAVAGITPLDIDHTTLLGNSMEQIAWNKAGIMKPGSIVFSAPQPETAMKVLKERSIERQCTLKGITEYYSQENDVRIPGDIQKINTTLALSISNAYINLDTNNNRIFSLDLAKKAIETCHWPGRYEIINRKKLRFFLDGAHTVESLKVCANWFISKVNSMHPKVLIFNITGERNSESLLAILSNIDFDIAIFVPNIGSDKDNADTHDNVLTISKQMEKCKIHEEIWLELHKNNGLRKSIVKRFPSVYKAVQFLEQDDKKYEVLVTGSIHLIGAAMYVLDPHLHGTL